MGRGECPLEVRASAKSWGIAKEKQENQCDLGKAKNRGSDRR